MQSEADFKKTFKKSVRVQKGFSLSLAAPMIIGVPDLYVIMPGYMPVLLEAKWLGTVGTKFKRKINYTAMQLHWLKECNRVCGYSALGLVGYKRDGEYWAALVGPDNPGYLQNDNFIDAVYIQYEKGFDILKLFNDSKVPRINVNEFTNFDYSC